MLVHHCFVLRCVAAPRGSSCAIALSAEELLGHTAGWKISLEYIIIKFPCKQGLNYFQGSRDHGYSWVMMGQRYHGSKETRGRQEEAAAKHLAASPGLSSAQPVLKFISCFDTRNNPTTRLKLQQ